MTAPAPTFDSQIGPRQLANGSPVFSIDTAALTKAPMRYFVSDIDASLKKISILLRSDRRPTENAVDLASTWLTLVFETACKLGGWTRPHIASTEAGEIIFEWWRGKRKLTIYFGDAGPEFIEVWGSDIENEMRSGRLEHWSFINAWQDLNS